MKKLVSVLSLAILWSTCGHAAEMLLKSSPANGSVTDKPPSTFVLDFSERVRLYQLFIKRDDEKRWKEVSKIPNNEATSFTVPMPALAAGGYTLRWTVFGSNSTSSTGNVRFTVSGEQLGSASSH